MWTDPIVEEVRRVRDEYAARFNYDLDAMAKDLRRMAEQLKQDGWEVVSLSSESKAPSGVGKRATP